MSTQDLHLTNSFSLIRWFLTRKGKFSPQKSWLLAPFSTRLSSVVNVTRNVEVSLFDASIAELFIIEVVFPSTASPYQTDSSCSLTLFLLIFRCPNHYQSGIGDSYLLLDSSSDYMHKALQEQFDVFSFFIIFITRNWKELRYLQVVVRISYEEGDVVGVVEQVSIEEGEEGNDCLVHSCLSLIDNTSLHLILLWLPPKEN